MKAAIIINMGFGASADSRGFLFEAEE